MAGALGMTANFHFPTVLEFGYQYEPDHEALAETLTQMLLIVSWNSSAHYRTRLHDVDCPL